MLDVAVLAATVVGKFLIPLFTKGKDKLTDELAQTGADAAAGGLVQTAQTLWQKIKDRFDGDDEKSTVTLFEKKPVQTEALLTEALQERLTHDEAFRQQLIDLVQAPVAGTGMTSWQLMGDYVAAVDARGATVSGGGQIGGMIFNSPAPSPHPTLPPPAAPAKG
jgi:hypothetical protein